MIPIHVDGGCKMTGSVYSLLFRSVGVYECVYDYLYIGSGCVD